MPPRATYRVQLSKHFGFDAVAGISPYLAKLGISHLYCSSYLKARPGSTHGYDVVDHDALNPELGDAAAFERMTAALRANGLKQILDIVPNHMGVGGADNPAWLDVLEWGQASTHAGWFDIDWTPDRDDLRDKVLVPFLGDQLGTEIEAGNLTLTFDAATGGLAVWAYETHRLPIAPQHYVEVLGAGTSAIERIGDAFANLPTSRPNERERAATLKAELATLVADDPEAGRAISIALARYRGRPGEPGSWVALADLIGRQFWRPAYFRAAADDINYRRFFNIAELAGLRMELPAVFDHAHQLVFRLMADGIVDGLRIDHIDGLLDPKNYLLRLRAKAPWSGAEPFYLVVEKILGLDEPLPGDWPVDGTTGYEAGNELLGLMIDPAGEAAFTRIDAAFAGATHRFDDLLRASKKRIVDDEMASELATLALAASRIAKQSGRSADFTRNVLRRAIRATVAAFPVYRTYVDHDGAGDRDRATIAAAIEDARQRETSIDASVFTFLQQSLTGDLVAEPRSGYSRSAVLGFAMRFQQYSGPVMAKGLEDTAFYRANRFIALNEVGGDPRVFGRPVDRFHAANAERAKRWPHAMLSTSTHDTKRGEDARARLAVLSEIPDDWAEAVAAWRGLLRRETDCAPDRNDEYALYQTLVATVPPTLLEAFDGRPEDWQAYAVRVGATMRKTMRESRVHSSWAAPDEAYEAAMTALIETALTGEQALAFRAAFLPFASDVARLGVDNSLLQTALKLTMPGMPDFYQGCELWDLSMVDPDNRRPVDFATRARLLDELRTALAADRAATMANCLTAWPDGRIKLALTATLLELRARQADLFATGFYRPLSIDGPEADSLVAFERRLGPSVIAIVAARFPARRRSRPISASTAVALPPVQGAWTEVLTGRRFERADLPALLSSLPVAVLEGGHPET